MPLGSVRRPTAVPVRARARSRRVEHSAPAPAVFLSFRRGDAPPAVRGALVIESGEGGSVVTFRGDWIRVTEPGSNRQFELRAGECEIEVRELPGGASFFTRQFVLRQGGKVFLAVRHEARRETP